MSQEALFDLKTPPAALTAPPTREDLVPPETLLPVVAAIRGHVAGNAVGVTRDETIARELVKILHAKTIDELGMRRRKGARFYWLPHEPPQAASDRVNELLSKSSPVEVHGRTGRAWEHSGEVTLAPESVAFAVQQLQAYKVLEAKRDVLGEAFEALIGPALRGAEGQFFTPRNLVQMCVEMLAPTKGERILDPACGAGGFLGDALRYLVSAGQSIRKDSVVGVDKDAFLATLCADHLALYSDKCQVFCENSLDVPTKWSTDTQRSLRIESFDVILTNPPFGAAIPVKGAELLAQYELAQKWKRVKGSAECVSTGELLAARPPQVLFVERCLQFLKPGGRAAIVLPEGVFGNDSDSYVRQLVANQAEILAVVDCPLETFMPSTPTKTCVLFLRKNPNNGSTVGKTFLAIAKTCGHDRRGKPLLSDDGEVLDDFPAIASVYAKGSR